MSDNVSDVLSAPELILLKSAARLLEAVRWLQEHPPLHMQWDYFNDKVREEIVSVIDQSLYWIYILSRCCLAYSSLNMLMGQVLFLVFLFIYDCTMLQVEFPI